MAQSAIDHLQQKWTDCYKANEALEQENGRLKDQLAELQRKQKVIADNAYEDGYNAGQTDAKKQPEA